VPRKFGRGNTEFVDVDALLDATTTELVRELVRLGALVSFGTSRDGGALSVHVRSGEIRDRDWFRSDEELHDWLDSAVELIRGAVTLPPTSQVPLKAV